MADQIFENPRLVAIYDAFDGERRDLAAYVAMAKEFEARRVIDVGCGTGSFVIELLNLGLEVTGVDPAAASLDAAQRKPGAHAAVWIHGDATALSPACAEFVVMTGNVAQAIVDHHDWAASLRAIHRALVPGGRFVFETRIPAQRAWDAWNKEASLVHKDIPGVGPVTAWVEVTSVEGPLVSFRWTYVFGSDNEVLFSDSTLRFREHSEVVADLWSAGFVVEDVRDAPDRPGTEHVFVARLPAEEI